MPSAFSFYVYFVYVSLHACELFTVRITSMSWYSVLTVIGSACQYYYAHFVLLLIPHSDLAMPSAFGFYV